MAEGAGLHRELAGSARRRRAQAELLSGCLSLPFSWQGQLSPAEEYIPATAACLGRCGCVRGANPTAQNRIALVGRAGGAAGAAGAGDAPAGGMPTLKAVKAGPFVPWPHLFIALPLRVRAGAALLSPARCCVVSTQLDVNTQQCGAAGLVPLAQSFLCCAFRAAIRTVNFKGKAACATAPRVCRCQNPGLRREEREGPPWGRGWGWVYAVHAGQPSEERCGVALRARVHARGWLPAVHVSGPGPDR